MSIDWSLPQLIILQSLICSEIGSEIKNTFAMKDTNIKGHSHNLIGPISKFYFFFKLKEMTKVVFTHKKIESSFMSGRKGKIYAYA